MNKLLQFSVVFAFSLLTFTSITSQTICNPLNLSYRFRPEINEISRREAADPTMVVFKNEYYLFASKTGGYWHSKNLTDWTLIEINEIPTEDYAPTAWVMDNAIYFMASASKSPILKSTDPTSGKWQVVVDSFAIPSIDPCFFLDDDNRLYFYWGCSNVNPIHGIEIDRNTFKPIGEPKDLIFPNTAQHGWENPGDYNQLTKQAPWIEGSWMNKHNGKYYLQYAGPGTEYKGYSDAVYVSNLPLGSYKVADNNPMIYKPEGFIAGIGHGSTFKDIFGNYWHIGTMTISVKHMFERRLGLHPVFFDNNNQMYSYTAYGDYPLVVPQKKMQSPEEINSGLMLLSYNKPVQVSSELTGFPSKNAVNEDIRTYWSAATGNKGEWILVNLEKKSIIHSIQINFAEQDVQIYSRSKDCYYQYLLEYSNDGKIWSTLIDKSQNQTDVPHDYIHMQKTVDAQYVRLTNIHVPGGKFAISGLRIFGKGNGLAPKEVEGFNATRNSDKRVAELNWNKVENAVGYNITFGSSPETMYQNYMVYADNSIVIRSLNSTFSYYFKIEAFNENGKSKGSQVVKIE